MSRQASEFLRQARRAKQQAQSHSEEQRSVLLSIGDAYELLARLARIQEAVDAKMELYPSRGVH
jgi:hypothetical protein